ncbi:MAG TPA: translocation/assembly module TamB domain-containing protein, partial [Stellaceae bacterium]|nr:translocation/assembly module TamB domain-containing protein [Stellaceae bacterium]
PIHGRIQTVLHLAGLMESPEVTADIAGWGLGAEGYGLDHTALHLTAARQIKDGRIHLTLGGGAQGVMQNGVALPAKLGGNISIAVDAVTDPGLTRLTLNTANVASDGLAIDAKGGMAREPGMSPAFQGHATVSVADLSLFRDIAGMPLGGKADLVLDANAAKGTGGTDLTVSGTVSDPKSGVAALDALSGKTLHIDAKASQGADGLLALSQATLKGNAFDLTASGTLDAAKRLAAKAKLNLPNLAPLGRALGNPMGGSATLDLTASGTATDPAIKADFATKALRSGTMRFTQAKATANVPRLGAGRGSIVLTVASRKVNGRLTADIARERANRITIGNIALVGTGSRANGTLTIDLTRKLATGSLHGDIQDIGPWAGLAGIGATGRAFADLTLVERHGQGIDLNAGLTSLALAGAARTTLDRLSLHAHLGNLLAVPEGNAELDLTNLHSGEATIAQANFRAQSGAKGSFDFNAGATGRWHNPLNLSLAGTTMQQKGGVTVRVSRFQAALGQVPFRLQQTLVLSFGGGATKLQDLNLALGRGSLTGSFARTARTLNVDLTGRDIPIGGIATQAGQPGIGGTLKLDLHVAGPYQGLAGQFSVAVPDLRLAAADHPELPPLNLTANANLSGGMVTLQGQVTTLKQETVRFHSSLPVVIAKDGSDVRIARGTTLNGAINGSGELADMASILPLGEDRLSGKFLIDLNIAGTFEQPQASCSVKINGGSYDSMASGMTLRHLVLDLEGNQTALEIHQLTADDGGSGKLTGSGRIRLDTQGPPAMDLAVNMDHFTATRLDEATIVTSGKTTVSGTTLAPKIAGAITINKADINIPDKLPPNVPTLQVIRINSKLPRTRPPPPPLVPPVVMTFAETLTSTGQVFVRGRGLNSEWRSDIRVSGTSVAPVVEGTITAVHGSFSVLGKDFNVQSGTVRFTGSATDPSLDLTAQRVASDTTVTVNVTGTVNKPKLTMTSSPPLPQDEILARVLFGEGVSQMSPVQALQLAQAVASLSGQGPDVLGSLRNATGLDQLGVTSGNPGSSSSGSMTGTAVTGGKYIAPGVFLGADKGIGPGTTRGRLEIEVTPHVTLNAAVGAASTSSNLGVEYHLDY